MTEPFKDAIISPCGTYRYALLRGVEPRLAFVMLNPSTADALVDDPTIRRCVRFAAREGFGGIEVMNLYALRATNPSALETANDPEGPDNLDHLRGLAERHKLIVCAWGANADRGHARGVFNQLSHFGARLVSLGTTRGGHPRHPLYVRADQQLEDYHSPTPR